MLTCPCNVDPLTPHFYIVKLGFTGVYIIFALKHRLWVFVSTALFGGAVAWWLTPRTPDPEVGGSSPTLVAVLCP